MLIAFSSNETYNRNNKMGFKTIILVAFLGLWIGASALPTITSGVRTPTSSRLQSREDMEDDWISRNKFPLSSLRRSNQEVHENRFKNEELPSRRSNIVTGRNEFVLVDVDHSGEKPRNDQSMELIRQRVMGHDLIDFVNEERMNLEDSDEMTSSEKKALDVILADGEFHKPGKVKTISGKKVYVPERSSRKNWEDIEITYDDIKAVEQLLKATKPKTIRLGMLPHEDSSEISDDTVIGYESSERTHKQAPKLSMTHVSRIDHDSDVDNSGRGRLVMNVGRSRDSLRTGTLRTETSSDDYLNTIHRS